MTRFPSRNLVRLLILLSGRLRGRSSEHLLELVQENGETVKDSEIEEEAIHGNGFVDSV